MFALSNTSWFQVTKSEADKFFLTTFEGRILDSPPVFFLFFFFSQSFPFPFRSLILLNWKSLTGKIGVTVGHLLVSDSTACTTVVIRELEQPRRQFAYLTMKNSIFARIARALFIFWHFEDVLVLSMTWNDLFCICMDDVSIWWQIQFCLPTSEALFPVNSRIVRTHFAIVITLNNWETIAETRSYIFRWRSHCGRSPVFLSSL